MKKLFAIAALVVSAQFAQATVAPELIEEIPQSVFPSLEAEIKAAVLQETGFKQLKDFKIDWNNVQNCMEVRSEMDDTKLMGACSVSFGAFQVHGEVLVIAKLNGYSSSVLYVNVE